ncbi:hypothetical protein ACWEOH_08610 [Agromyces sp. NPDC004153]
MHALSALARTWPMLCALGAGLVLLALAAGAGGMAGGLMAAAGAAGLGWGVLSLRAGRALVPGVVLGTGAALLVGAGLLVGSGLAEAAGVPVGSLLAASVFIAVVTGHCAVVVRGRSAAHGARDGRSDAPAPRAAAVDGRLPLVGLVVGALLVAGLATPALAATEAGRVAVPHGEHDHQQHH